MTPTDYDPRESGGEPRVVAHSVSEKPERPSVLQTLAGALTAITVTYLMSFLGVAGTVIGVGLVSVLTVMGNFLYSSAMHTAKEKVAQVQRRTRNRGHGGEAAAADSASGPDSSEVSGTGAPGRWRRVWREMLQRYGWRKIAGWIALVFVLLAGTVTIIELSVGKPLSAIVRNEDGSGTSLFGDPAGEDTGETEEDTEEDPPPQENEGPEEGPPVDGGGPEDDDGVVEGPTVPDAPEEQAPDPGQDPPDQGEQAPQQGVPENQAPEE